MKSSNTDFFAAPRRIGRKRRTPSGSPEPTTLTLIAAEYDPEVSVTLTFNQPIDVDGVVADLIAVSDGEIAQAIFTGSAVLSSTDTSVTVSLVAGSPVPWTGVVTLTVNDGNGIVPAGGGSEWFGVTELVLPFG